MNNKTKPSPLGQFLKAIREKRGLNIHDVERATGISNVYISQLETGARQSIPWPSRLRLLAKVYDVPVSKLLERVGYLTKEDIGEPEEKKVEQAFLHVISDPIFKKGMELRGKKYIYDLDTKRFIIEMYETLKNEKLLRT